ncbi:hypothetical protein ACT3OH_19805, partial [Vreelandella zhanjiangensis]|uniref:hypothetical protein n=1 Tax=Vreelandella zhanjiangensis TaxID=1121960 RepID=UPI00402A602E
GGASRLGLAINAMPSCPHHPTPAALRAASAGALALTTRYGLSLCSNSSVARGASECRHPREAGADIRVGIKSGV